MQAKFIQEIQQQPDAVRKAVSWLASDKGQSALGLVETLWSGGRRDLLFTGMGSSAFVCEMAAGLCNRCGLRARFINAAELLHYQLPSIGEDTLLVCISQSGESYETLKVAQAMDGDYPIVAVCNDTESSLAIRAKSCGVLLECCAGREEMTSTKTFVNTHLVCCALVARLGSGDILPLASTLAFCMERTLSGAAEYLPACRRLLGENAFVQVLGRGSVSDAVSQTALMFMEAAATPSSAMNCGEFRHGPIEAVGPGFTAVMITSSSSRTHKQCKGLAEDILRYGGRLIYVSDNPLQMKSENLCNVVVPLVPAHFFSMVAILPLQLIVNDLASRKGLIAGTFTHGNKITGRE